MPPACEIEPQYGIAWLKQSEQDCEIGIGARVWLDIGKGRAEQTTGAFDREPFDSVRGHAPTIVTCARITLGIFVGEDRSLRGAYLLTDDIQIGRASCRESVCQYV